MSKIHELTKGIVKENPVLFGLLGMCPTLAITTMAINGLGMGLATTFVLVCSNLVISLLKNFIPEQVRLPSFIVIIAGFVTLVSFLMGAYLPQLYESLGLFLSLIVVNCIILGRAEVFASKNSPFTSILDGLGMGIGFTGALIIIGAVREIFGSGKIFGYTLPGDLPTMQIFILPAGGFFVLGVLIAVVNKIASRTPPEKIECGSCPSKGACGVSESD